MCKAGGKAWYVAKVCGARRGQCRSFKRDDSDGNIMRSVVRVLLVEIW